VSIYPKFDVSLLLTIYGLARTLTELRAVYGKVKGEANASPFVNVSDCWPFCVGHFPNATALMEPTS
jgi:hypothetical protein